MPVLEYKQILPVSRERAWEFFSQPDNLIGITPPHFRLKLETDTRSFKLENGSHVFFSLSLLPGVRIGWKSLFSMVSPPEYFEDRHEGFLFRYWWHQHGFKARGHVTEVTDRLEFSLRIPLFNPIAVFMINKMFRFRQMKLNQYFN